MKENLDILQEKLKSMLKHNSFERTELATTWKIKPSRLAHHKVSNLIFEQKKLNTGKKYNVELLLDISNSMYWQKFERWLETLQKLVKLFYGVIDFNIHCFSTIEKRLSPKYVLSLNSKDFDYGIVDVKWEWVKINWQETIMDKEDGTIRTSYGTWEVNAVMNAVDRLKAKQWEGLIILIGDGQMERWHVWWDEHHVMGRSTKVVNMSTAKGIVKQLEESGNKILALWMRTDDFSGTYSNSENIEDLDNVYPAVIDFIRSNFH